jgi:two-component system LytT family sensor kinase
MSRYQKPMILLLFLFLWGGNGGINQAFAQGTPFGHQFIFEMVTTRKLNMVREPLIVGVSDTAVYHIFDRLKKDNKNGLVQSVPKTSLLLGVKLNPSLVKYFSAMVQSISKEYQSFIIADSTNAVLIAMGINATNVKDYRYRVVENDSIEIVPWSPIPKLAKEYGAKQAYGFLGKYNAPGKRLMIEVVHCNNYSLRDGVIFDWRVNFKPILIQITVDVPKGYFNLAYTNLNRGYATRFDPKTGLPLNLRFPVDSVEELTLKFKKQETLVQSVYLVKSLNNKKDTSRLGFVDQYGYFQLGSEYFAKPGHYEILVKQQEKVPIWDDAKMVKIPFDVLPTPVFDKRFSMQQLLPYLIGTLLSFMALLFGFQYYNKRKLLKVQQQQQTAQLKLKTIRSQLNPHFMFNALSSIQNLMNKNELLPANHYLSKFAGLTRKVLNNSEQEMISLQEEIQLTEDYLQMEQLRFGFQYQLEVDPEIDIVNIEIPTLLLQPFIENAIKHGITSLKEKGNILVNISQHNKNLVIKINDNGKGFNASQTNKDKSSFGLKLSQERIALLNQLYKEQPTLLQIDSIPSNTTISLTLTNWI